MSRSRRGSGWRVRRGLCPHRVVEDTQRLRQAARDLKAFLSGRNELPALRRGAALAIPGPLAAARGPRFLERRTSGRGGDRVDGMFYDALETRDPAEREAALMAALPRVIAAAKEHAPPTASVLAKVRPEDVTDRRALVDLPLTRKSDLIEMQRRDPPFGGLAAVPVSGWRGFSPRPARSTSRRRAGRISSAWRGRLYAAGIRPGDLVHNAFSYHLTPAGAMVESAAQALGCPVIPAGTGQTEKQLRTIADLRPGRLCRHAVLPENPARPRRRRGRRYRVDQKRAGRRRGVSGGIAGRVPRARHRRAAMLRHRRSRPDRV